MLYEFLIAERENILALCRKKSFDKSIAQSSMDEMDKGLAIFYQELTEVLGTEGNQGVLDRLSQESHQNSATARGKDSLRLGYTISQVVHGYGALCQSITEYAAKQADEPITAKEFNRLNFCLDEAIGQAVTAFHSDIHQTSAQDEVQRLGFLAHELRNALANAMTAHQMLKMGLVGYSGSTSRVLETAHRRMKDIIDRSLSEVRLSGKPTVNKQSCRVIDLVGEVEATALPEASAQSILLHVEIDPNLTVLADRHLIVSAISNLVQNAIKFTHSNGNVWIRTVPSQEYLILEIADECGGLSPGKIESLFQPYVQDNIDKTGVGLGLAISRQAIELNGGRLIARNVTGKGCVFVIELPHP